MDFNIALEKAVLAIKLMKSATSSVEFSFNSTTYKQTDGAAVGSPLGSALASIFVGYHEEKFSHASSQLSFDAKK